MLDSLRKFLSLDGMENAFLVGVMGVHGGLDPARRKTKKIKNIKF